MTCGISASTVYKSRKIVGTAAMRHVTDGDFSPKVLDGFLVDFGAAHALDSHRRAVELAEVDCPEAALPDLPFKSQLFVLGAVLVKHSTPLCSDISQRCQIFLASSKE